MLLHEISRFDSFSDFLAQVHEPLSSAMRLAWGSPQSERGSESFTATRDYAHALSLATHGWESGWRSLRCAVDTLAPYVHAASAAPSEALDVAGYAPCVPAYCAGAPACMYSSGDTSTSVARVVRILVNGTVTHMTPTASIMHRGAALVAAIQYLEDCGLRCEVELGFCTRAYANAYADETGRSVWKKNVTAINEAYIPVKSAGQSIDEDRFAFMLAHPSVLRRLIFRLWEQHVAAGPAMRDTYGRPVDMTPASDQVYIPAVFGGREYATPQEALRHVLHLIANALPVAQQARVTEDWRNVLTDTRL